MNRREALAALSAAAASVVPGATVEAKDADKPLLVVIRTDRRVSDAQRYAMQSAFQSIQKGTALDGVPCMVLTPGIDVDIINWPKP